MESLTHREKEILKLIAEGKSNRDIANRLCISVRTAARHGANWMIKLNARKTAELAQYAMRRQYI